MKKQGFIKTFSYLIIGGLLAFSITKCANPVSPTGGPKDETPPMAVSAEPENYSSHFSEKEMNVKFNEFIQLKELQQQMLVSPPMEHKPEIKIKKKSVVIKLDKEEKLKENTTYTIFLGNAVVDLTESNPYLNFEYVFSTGNFVDSLSINGIVKNTFSGLPAENVSVMLYTDNNDSIPLDSLPILIRPDYVAKTDVEGKFSLNNLKDTPYKIFALSDQNSNYLYDLPYEEIAFLDSMIQPYHTGPRRVAPIDTTATDTMPSSQYNYITTELFMFSSIDSTQDIAEYDELNNYQIQVLLDFPCNDYTLNPLNFDPNLDWKIDEPNTRKDSIIIWLRPVVPDTIQLEFIADGILLDTLEFNVKKAPKKSSGNKGLFKKKTEIDTVKTMSIIAENNIKGNTAELNKKVKIEFDYPLETYDFSSFIWMEDSVVSNPKVQFSDSSKRHLIINEELAEDVSYELIIPDSVLFNIHGNTNDSLKYNFKTKTKDKYGNLILTIIPEQTDTHWIIQLMNTNNIVLKEQIINKSETIRFEYLKPGNYKLRAIRDNNKNGHWDTGNYTYKRQAEKVIYLNSEIELRANWDYEENWNLK